MLELICDHSYTWTGLPADKSPYKNHGKAVNTGGADDGFAPGSGVITFPHPDSRVRIDPDHPWQSLVGMKIEVVARMDPAATPVSVLVAGDRSFRFGVSEGALEAGFVNATGSNNFVRASVSFAPDHKYHRIPANKWVTFGFHHDGFAKMRLFMEGELVGESIIDGSILPVHSLGVSIGNAADVNGLQFPGQIDEVRIWRLDPKAIKREFLGRPQTRATADCWERFIAEVEKWGNENPGRLRELSGHIAAQKHGFLRALLLLEDGDQARLRAILASFLDLWCAGNIGGPEMEEVMCDWIRTLRAVGIDPGQGFPANALAEVKLAGRNDLLECDEQIAALIELVRKTEESCGTTSEVAT